MPIFGLSYTTTACGACVNVSAGPALPIAFSWDNGISTQCANGIPPGNYLVTVTDANGFWDTITVSTVLQAPVHVTLATTGISTCPCYLIGLTTGASPYTYAFNGISGMTANPLCEMVPGQYYMQVTDANGCMADTFLNVPASALYVMGTVTPALCRNGTATVTPHNGTAPYTYLWNTVPPQTDSVAVGLQANNTYTITVTDDSGCTQDPAVFYSYDQQSQLRNLHDTGYLRSRYGNDGGLWIIRVPAVPVSLEYKRYRSHTHEPNQWTLFGNNNG
jgi:hypothetical protein